MSQVEILEREIRRLPKDQARKLQAWLADYLEDQETLSPEFLQRIEHGKRDVAEGSVRRKTRENP
jgi:hypothetical protein